MGDYWKSKSIDGTKGEWLPGDLSLIGEREASRGDRVMQGRHTAKKGNVTLVVTRRNIARYDVLPLS